jgi:hypothetical protein
MITFCAYARQVVLSERPCRFGSGWRHLLLKDENGHVAWRDVRKEWVR